MNPAAAHANFALLEEPLAQTGFAHLDTFLSTDECALLRSDVLARRQEFHPARVGPKSLATHARDVRSDETLWFDAQHLSPAQHLLWTRLEDLRLWLNAEFRLSLFDWEGHYAVYEPGAFYERHVDRFQSDSRRTLSTVVYLGHSDGEPWTPASQGELALYDSDAPPHAPPRQKIAPLAGRLACFRSDQIVHAVLPTQKTRLSVAGWFRTRT